MTRHDNYKIFTDWYKSMNWLWDKAEKFPKNVRFSLASRIISVSLEITELIVEMIYVKNKEKRPLLRRLNVLLEKMRILVRISHDRRYLSTQQYQYISNQINEVGKQVGGWLRSL